MGGRHKPRRLPEGSKEKIYLALKSTRTKGQYKKALCLWMRAELEMTSDDIARALAMSPQGVRKIQARWLHVGDAVFKEAGKGGAHHRRLTEKVERAFLERLLQETLPANAVMSTRFVQEEFEKKVGRPVSYSVIYRMLKRHGWRPIGDVAMSTPPRWESAKLPFAGWSRRDGNSPAAGETKISDAEFEAAMKDYDSPGRPLGRGMKRGFDCKEP